jgi:UDPglucose--hexose-1-phosphate uridylyltransferase
MMDGGGPEIRTNTLTGESVVVAASRSTRPHDTIEGEQTCPFCPGHESLTPPTILELKEDGTASNWYVRVVENLFPIVGQSSGLAPTTQNGAFRSAPAAGAHEVVIETPHHDQEIPDREPGQLLLTLQAWQARVQAQFARREIRYVVIFKNRGVEAGTSLEHSHSQIAGLSVVPSAVLGQIQAARRYFRRSGRCRLCEDVRAEREAGERVVFDEDGFIAYVPFAAPFAGQVRIIAKAHAPSFTDASEATLAAMSRCLRLLLVRLDAGFDRPAFNLILTTAPKAWNHDPALHWYLEIIPRIARVGGFELATSLQISTLSPEDGAQLYRVAHTAS